MTCTEQEKELRDLKPACRFFVKLAQRSTSMFNNCVHFWTICILRYRTSVVPNDSRNPLSEITLSVDGKHQKFLSDISFSRVSVVANSSFSITVMSSAISHPKLITSMNNEVVRVSCVYCHSVCRFIRLGVLDKLFGWFFTKLWCNKNSTQAYILSLSQEEL